MSSMTDKPSREDVLRVAEEYGIKYYLTPANTREMHGTDSNIERFAAAMYAAGAEDTRERAVPEGWKLVPIEPTDKMLEALYRASGYHPRTVYRDLVAALAIAPTNTEGEQDERKDYCGSCGEWTGGPVICCHESQSANHKPDVTKTEAIAVRQTLKERMDGN